MAKLLALKARIFVPIGTAASRIQAIQGEGAEVIVVDGTYDEAVRRAAQEESENCLVISDTSWPGYEKVTSWVVEGYSTLFWEVEDDLARRGEKGPDLVFVQVGVGSLAAAAVRHYRRKDVKDSPFIVSVEPQTAACALASIKAGGRVSVPGPHRSIMAGLNCGEPSLVAWPILKDGVDMFMAIDDGRAMAAMRDLASEGIVSGETGAAGLGGLKELLAGPYSGQARKRLDIGQHTRVLLISTEGATNPDFYRQVVGG
jgi:diaminopropionate ammonia-lyase